MLGMFSDWGLNAPVYTGIPPSPAVGQTGDMSVYIDPGQYDFEWFARTVACPVCKSFIGWPCIDSYGRVTVHHTDRWHLATKAIQW